MHLIMSMAGSGSRTREIFQGPKPFLPIGENQVLLHLALAGLPWREIAHVTFAINDEVESWVKVNGLVLKDFVPAEVTFEVINVGKVTSGQASTVDVALAHTKQMMPVLVANCDTYFETTLPSDFLDYDGLLGVFRSQSPNYSYARLNDLGDVVETAEKKVISTLASSGLYYFKSAELFRNALRNTPATGEHYIAPLYNFMISSNLRVGVFQHGFVTPLGTAQEIQTYMSKNLHKFN